MKRATRQRGAQNNLPTQRPHTCQPTSQCVCAQMSITVSTRTTECVQSTQRRKAVRWESAKKQLLHHVHPFRASSLPVHHTHAYNRGRPTGRPIRVLYSCERAKKRSAEGKDAIHETKKTFHAAITPVGCNTATIYASDKTQPRARHALQCIRHPEPASHPTSPRRGWCAACMARG